MPCAGCDTRPCPPRIPTCDCSSAFPCSSPSFPGCIEEPRAAERRHVDSSADPCAELLADITAEALAVLGEMQATGLLPASAGPPTMTYIFDIVRDAEADAKEAFFEFMAERAYDVHQLHEAFGLCVGDPDALPRTSSYRTISMPSLCSASVAASRKRRLLVLHLQCRCVRWQINLLHMLSSR